MGYVLSISDFENGSFRIPINPSQEYTLNEVIDSVENEYLPKLFGNDLNELFLNDLSLKLPTTQRFEDVFFPFTKQNDSVMIQSKGIVEMLKGFVYFFYVRDIVSRVTSVDVSSVIGENAEGVGAIKHDVVLKYNSSVDTFQTLQYFMQVYDEVNYPEFKGVSIPYTNII